MRTVALLILLALPASAQFLTVTGEFRVVDIDRGEKRVGVARVEDDPTHRQNWVYIKHDTTIVKRNYYGDGKFKDEFITGEGVMNALEKHKGKVLKVHGGRDWDGSIDAKKSGCNICQGRSEKR